MIYLALGLAVATLVGVLYWDRERLLKELQDLHRQLRERETDANEKREQMFNAMLQMRSLPNGAPLPQYEAPGKIWTRDERDSINDSIDEYVEMKQMKGESVTREEARMFVWNRNGFLKPQF